MQDSEGIDRTKLLRGLKGNLQSALEALEFDPVEAAIGSLADIYRESEEPVERQMAARYLARGFSAEALIRYYQSGEEAWDEIKDSLHSALTIARQMSSDSSGQLSRHALIDALAATFHLQCYLPERDRLFSAARGYEAISEIVGDVAQDELRHLYRFRPALGRLLHYQAFYAVRTGQAEADQYLSDLTSLTDVDYRSISLDPEKVRLSKGARRRELAYYFEYSALRNLREDNLQQAVKELRAAADTYKQPPWEELRRKSSDRVVQELSLKEAEAQG